MELYEAIYSRRTIRDFKDEKISKEIIEKIINAGLQAPSNDHMRSWEFIIMDDKEPRLEVLGKINKARTKEEAIHIIDQWGFVDEYQRDMYVDAIPKQYKMLLDAGCIIFPCFRQKSPLLEPQNLSALNAFASIWCCIENILLAAANEGIYGVVRIPIDEELLHIKTVTNVPSEYEIPCYIALGYPGDNAKQLKQHTAKAEERIHFNHW